VVFGVAFGGGWGEGSVDQQAKGTLMCKKMIIGGQIGELIVGWALVGLVLAKVMGNGTSSDD